MANFGGNEGNASNAWTPRETLWEYLGEKLTSRGFSHDGMQVTTGRPNILISQQRLDSNRTRLGQDPPKEKVSLHLDDFHFDPSDFRRLRLHEAIFKGFDGERVMGPVRVYLKPYWKARWVSYFEDEAG